MAIFSRMLLPAGGTGQEVFLRGGFIGQTLIVAVSIHEEHSGERGALATTISAINVFVFGHEPNHHLAEVRVQHGAPPPPPKMNNISHTPTPKTLPSGYVSAKTINNTIYQGMALQQAAQSRPEKRKNNIRSIIDIPAICTLTRHTKQTHLAGFGLLDQGAHHEHSGPEFFPVAIRRRSLYRRLEHVFDVAPCAAVSRNTPGKRET